MTEPQYPNGETPRHAGPHNLILRPQHTLQTDVLRSSGAEELVDDDGLNLKDLGRVVWKNKWMILGVCAAMSAAGFVQSLRGTAMYRATAQIQIERAAQQVVSFGRDVDANQNVWDDGTGLQTQIELLRSRALAERVVDTIGLAKQGEANASQLGQAEGAGLPGSEAANEGGGLLAQLTATWRKLQKPSVKNSETLDRNSTVSELMGSVSIEPVRNTRLVNVAADSSNPELAARIANAFAETYIALNLERKVESSLYAKRFLEDQIRVTKAKLEESERQLNEYTKRNSILVLGENTNVATQGFSDVAAALAKAEQERIRAEAQYNEVSRRPDSASQVLESKTIQTYKEEKAKLEAEYATNLSVYKPEFPKMVQLRAQIADVDTRIKTEISNIVASIKGQYEVARQQEDQLRQRLNQSRDQVQTVQDRSVDLNLLKREVTTNRELYDGLLQRLKEVGVTGGLTTNNISIVDTASTPLFPYSPRPARNALLGLALGLLLGLGIAFLREMLDDSIKHADEIESHFGVPLLGLIPLTKPEKGMEDSVAMLAHLEPRSAFSEAYRSMRTALQFSTADGAPRRFMVTSCGKAEGKSTTALALAINFAQLGQRVLLIDADMRKPSIHRSLHMPNERGLSNLLTGDMPGNEMLIHPTSVPNLSALTAGPTPPDPVELLMGPKFGLLLEKAQELGFTQVVIDGPPLLGIADAIVLGNQIQHVVFAVKAAGTKRASIKDALRRLRNAGIAPMGVVLTHARSEHSSDYSYDAYYGYGNEPASAAAALPTSSKRREPSLGKAEGPVAGFASSASGPASSPRHRTWLNPLVAGGAVAAMALLGTITWTLWPSGQGKAPTQNQVAGTLKDEVPHPVVTPAAASASAPAPVIPSTSAPLADVAPTTPIAAPTEPAVPESPAPELASLKDSPADTWPALANLWNAKFNPLGACDNAISAGLQCFRLPAASVADLREMDRPGLVQLKMGSVQRWVLLRSLDAQKVTLTSGTYTWKLPVSEFERQWTGGFSTLWRLPPGFQGRLFAAKPGDAASQWLDTQLKTLQSRQKLGNTEDNAEARLRKFQTERRIPGDGKALPSTFVLVNRLVNVDEPRLTTSD